MSLPQFKDVTTLSNSEISESIIKQRKNFSH